MLEDLLSGLDREQLQSLVLKLAEREPTLMNVIEELVGSPKSISSEAMVSPTAASPRRAQVDARAVRRQVRSILHSLDRMRSSDAYWHVGAVVNEVRQLLDQGWTLIQADDGRSALSLLEAITEAYISDWTNLDDSDGEASGFFHDLGPVWTEAVLSADLSSGERKTQAKKLEAWQQEIDDYGVEDVFAASLEAVIRGWDDPHLQRILQGIFSENDSWEGEEPEVIVARLHILERRGRLQEYLHLARVEGQNEAYVSMLVRLGRTQEAVAYGQAHLETAQEALTLATALYDRSEREQGLHIAERGLLLQGPKASLAKWLRDEAVKVGDQVRALSAAEVAFREELSLANYLRVAEIAGPQWPERRENLLEYARRTKSYTPQGQVDVFLHEGLIDDAIATVEPNATHTLIERVADAALQSHPDWVIKVCRQQAEPFMDEGKAQYYHAAANWLAKAHTAYRNMDREEEWQIYLSELLDRHRRKYKLVPMLEALRR
ncbi:hypothetical protein KSC_005970 [Ktedonobacter sp. SOSP1-52]|uniref:SWIM zinc finger domain-containing protein n=1 Tax=Ktedonobacter sp. SOSP1-52 TaxID=2778366 RepID=UPI001914EB56|nr:SWIM zinc finger domain-containing protein [Ktedonobacter sp. SOSP1-52]GHO61705.1 hypothetical protein KSC_005970 [Ktedonobacter sp. SOSP1-52]